MDCFDFFSLNQTEATRKDIKRAYGKLLKTIRPDQEPERFMELRAQYEEAIRRLSSADRSSDSELKSSHDLVEQAPSEIVETLPEQHKEDREAVLNADSRDFRESVRCLLTRSDTEILVELLRELWYLQRDPDIHVMAECLADYPLDQKSAEFGHLHRGVAISVAFTHPALAERLLDQAFEFLPPSERAYLLGTNEIERLMHHGRRLGRYLPPECMAFWTRRFVEWQDPYDWSSPEAQEHLAALPAQSIVYGGRVDSFDGIVPSEELQSLRNRAVAENVKVVPRFYEGWKNQLKLIISASFILGVIFWKHADEQRGDLEYEIASSVHWPYQGKKLGVFWLHDKEGELSPLMATGSRREMTVTEADALTAAIATDAFPSFYRACFVAYVADYFKFDDAARWIDQARSKTMPEDQQYRELLDDLVAERLLIKRSRRTVFIRELSAHFARQKLLVLVPDGDPERLGDMRQCYQLVRALAIGDYSRSQLRDYLRLVTEGYGPNQAYLMLSAIEKMSKHARTVEEVEVFRARVAF